MRGLFYNQFCVVIITIFLCQQASSLPDPIEHYLECGLSKPGRLCDSKSILSTQERLEANDALLKMPINNVFAYIEDFRFINYSEPGNFTRNRVDELPSTIALICQRHTSDCAPSSPIYVLEFTKLPKGSVGGERYDIALSSNSGSDEARKFAFDKALDGATSDFARFNLSSGLNSLAQLYNKYYAETGNVGWLAASYPNPCLNAGQCNMGNRVDAYICDPDSVMKTEQRQEVNTEFRNANQGNRLYAAIGKPITGDLDIFAKSLLANWSIECPKHNRPIPLALLVVSLPKENGAIDKEWLKSVATSNYPNSVVDLNAMAKSVMENKNSMTTLTERLIDTARKFNESWDGQHWRNITGNNSDLANVTKYPIFTGSSNSANFGSFLFTSLLIILFNGF